jgi:hypothetical protein
MTPELLAEIRRTVEKHAHAIGPGGEKAWLAGLLSAAAPLLLAEVDRLRAELAQVTGERDDALTTIRALVDLAAEDTTTIQPCQPIGCDNGYHLAGCRFADIDAAEHSGTEES